MNVGVERSSLVVVKAVLVSSLVVVTGSAVVVVSSSRVAVVSIAETVVVTSSPVTSVVVVNPGVAEVVALSVTMMTDSRVEENSSSRS
ncbi:uncharacterized protein B0J16DRAFT_52425 [Fusarium flagelliforme]|uniref:uncharacterized protein n=1 Tax=Fusarium flagelliforme TaxID=2675880 RepID=UPI001E8DE7C2|nr:uncharacterized protein B0J16DRAFT_52425 [Fusarium flagelliforme]KAH7191985.1 hypothetical protein B0J16DRAFT_52425 [Fusarium flagelliforme]